MSNIYQEAVRAVEDGAKFSVDFPSRSLKLNGRFIIQNGKYQGELSVPACNENEFIANLEERYRHYKHSVPSQRSEGKTRLYFKALPEKELSNEAMLYGERRDKAQLELELYLLSHIINGFKWNPEKMGKWFWQSKVDRDLIILRSWVEPDYN